MEAAGNKSKQKDKYKKWKLKDFGRISAE